MTSVAHTSGRPEDIVLMSDPRVAAVPVQECGDPLVDCRGLLRVDDRRGDPHGDWARLRRGVAERLVRAQELLPHGRRWLLVEGYRPVSLQRQIFDGYADRLRAAHPEADAAWLHEATARWCAPVETGGHTAGAAVDLTVCDEDGDEIDMGCPEAATPEESDGLCWTHAPGLTARARENRARMGEALGAVGMVNYPTEWWHWSYGDRYWAWTTSAPAACYGPVPDEEARAGR